MNPESTRLRLSQLKPGMIISEVLELSEHYAPLNPTTLAFLQKCFPGALAHHLDKRLATRVEQLREGDSIRSVVEIPPHLPMAKIGERSRSFYERFGLLEFLVGQRRKGLQAARQALPAPQRVVKMMNLDTPNLAPGSSQARELGQLRMVEAQEMLEAMEQGGEHRTQASDAVREMMDSGRKGQVSAKGVENVVSAIVRQGSSQAMRAIAVLRSSDQTYAHCTDMSVILQECYIDMQRRVGTNPPTKVKHFVLLCGFMHDIGKSEVPREILESIHRFEPDSPEMLIMRNHTTYGARILKEMNMPEMLINTALYHHVKMNQSLLNSYPTVAAGQKLHPITRLAAIVDAYQALIGRRNYKRSWTPYAAITYLSRLAGDEFDPVMVRRFVTAVGKYPIGSLVRLTSGEIGFVVATAPLSHPERPLVTVVENQHSERLTHYHTIDLMLHEDTRIDQVLDQYEHFEGQGSTPLDVFQSLEIS